MAFSHPFVWRNDISTAPSLSQQFVSLKGTKPASDDHKLDDKNSFLLLTNLIHFRCPKGNAAEAVADKLDNKLRDNLKDARNSLFGRYSIFLVIRSYLVRRKMG